MPSSSSSGSSHSSAAGPCDWIPRQSQKGFSKCLKRSTEWRNRGATRISTANTFVSDPSLQVILHCPFKPFRRIDWHFVVKQRPPFVTFERREEGGEIHGIGGFCFEIVHALRDAYNFTFVIRNVLRNSSSTPWSWSLFRYSVISPPELGTGTLAPNGSWNGIIGMLHQGVCLRDRFVVLLFG